MWAVRCDELGRDVLLHVSDVTGVENTPAGILVHYRCWCGRPGAVVTGAGADGERSGHLVTAS